MNYIDIFLLIVVFLAIWGGIARGFITGITELIAWAGCLIVAFLFYNYIADFIETYVSEKMGAWLYPLSFLFTFFVARMILSLITTPLLLAIPREVHGNFVNKILGIIPGIANGLIWAALIIALLLAFPLVGRLHTDIQFSKPANKLIVGIEWVEMKCAEIFDEAIKKTMNKLTIEPGSKQSVRLPYTVTEPEVRADLEEKMLALVNEERTERGLPPLEADPELTLVARAHSRDMFARGYFSHYSPEGRDAAYRIRKAGVGFLTAGENLALAQTLQLAHYGLMQSPGHRANILNTAYGRVGIGILDGGIHGLMVTQNFRN